MKAKKHIRNPYLLLTPGPLSTSNGVREAMLQDWCTWDDDYNVHIVQKIRRKLVSLATENINEYTSVLMQGSGTFSVEAAIGSLVPENSMLLVLSNGAYGQRIAEIARVLRIRDIIYEEAEDMIHNKDRIINILDTFPEITHLAMVHCETTTGILNNLTEVAEICREREIIFILDAMSSFGGIPMDIGKSGIDVMISSANKCIQGVPGFGFVVLKKDLLAAGKGRARSLSLDLYSQWKEMEDKNGKWRFTSPTHVVRAFLKALEELEAEGGIIKRYERYLINQRLLAEGMKELGVKTFLPEKLQSPIITSFLYPFEGFDFYSFYQYLKDDGFVIYPGKVSGAETFRIGSIGEVYPDDISRLLRIVKCYLEKRKRLQIVNS